MKSSDRHKLKSNELADSLVELKDYLNTHSSQIVAVLIGILVVILAFFWWQNSRQEQHIQQMASLQASMVNADIAQNQAVSYALDPKTKGAAPYKPAQITSQLGLLADDNAGTAIGALALLKRGDIIRSKLYFSQQPFTDKEKNALQNQAQGIYERVIKEYAKFPVIAGQAKLGLAMLAEQRGQWDKARQLYEQLASDKDKSLAGTVIPFQANERLQILPEIKTPVKFAPAKVLAKSAVKGKKVTTDKKAAGGQKATSNAGIAGKAKVTTKANPVPVKKVAPKAGSK